MRVGCDAGCVDAAEDRSDGADAHRGPHSARSAVESESNHRGKCGLEVEGDEPDDCHHDERAADIWPVLHVGEGRSKVASGAGALRPRNELTAGDACQGDEDGDVGNGVGVEAGGDPGDRNHCTAESGSDESRDRCDGAVGRHRAWEVVVSDELEQQGLHRWSFNGQHQSGQERESVDHPEVLCSARHDETERQCQGR